MTGTLPNVPTMVTYTRSSKV